MVALGSVVSTAGVGAGDGEGVRLSSAALGPLIENNAIHFKEDNERVSSKSSSIGSSLRGRPVAASQGGGGSRSHKEIAAVNSEIYLSTDEPRTAACSMHTATKRTFACPIPKSLEVARQLSNGGITPASAQPAHVSSSGSGSSRGFLGRWAPPQHHTRRKVVEEMPHLHFHIFASRVGDSVCDCCDGSDEYAVGNPFGVSCKNVCDL